MIDVDLQALIGALDGVCTRALEAAAGQSVSLTNHEVGLEHFLYAVLDIADADLPLLLAHYEVDVERFRKALLHDIEGLRTGSGGRPVFAPLLVELLQDALLMGTVEYGQGQVRSAFVLIAALAKGGRYLGVGTYELLKDINEADLRKNAMAVCGSSAEAGSTGGAARGGAPAPRGDALEQFCINFTQQARDGKIDPVFGRDAEIRQMVDILARRRKNNPIAVGDPGVGKTAVIEGLALRITEGDVPEMLQGVELLSLDLGLLQAGASVKGEFEKRLQAVIEQVKASPTPIILFIDEAHTLIGAGNQAGGGDAANLLKPALARGELRTVAATTWAEYKKYFEKDAALARRFQLVKLDEPDRDTVVTMLRGLKSRFEEAHNVLIRDDAVIAAAELGARYIVGRQHPDKGVDLIDTAAARVKITQATKPGALEDVQREIQALEREQAALERDGSHSGLDVAERLGDIADELADANDRAAAITDDWQNQKAKCEAVLAARKARDAGEEGADVDAALAELVEAQGDTPYVFVEVTAEVVAKVIGDWTGIPIGSLVSDEAVALLSLEERLTKRVKGQDHSMVVISEAIRAAKAGLKPAESPQGVFLLVGPSGTGKTETALTVADALFGGEDMMTTINMSEFMEKHNVSKLIGSPPGYVGYGEGGVLTNAVRQRPYSVVLLDECEKAHPEVMNLFYQVFDKGECNDGEGRRIDFSNTVLFLTSNLATDIITDMTRDGAKPSVDEITDAIRPALNAHFKPALVARMTVVPYYAIDRETMAMITRLKLGKLIKRLKASQEIELVVPDAVVDAIADKCTTVDTGARNIDHIIRSQMMPGLSRAVLDMLAGEERADRLEIGIDDGAFTYAFSSSGGSSSDDDEVSAEAEAPAEV